MNTHKLYTILTDIFHIVLGMLTVQLAQHIDIISSYVTPIPAYTAVFAILFTYAAYQVVDDDPPEEKVADMLEYATGMMLSIAI